MALPPLANMMRRRTTNNLTPYYNKVASVTMPPTPQYAPSSVTVLYSPSPPSSIHRARPVSISVTTYSAASATPGHTPLSATRGLRCGLDKNLQTEPSCLIASWRLINILSMSSAALWITCNMPGTGMALCRPMEQSSIRAFGSGGTAKSASSFHSAGIGLSLNQTCQICE